MLIAFKYAGFGNSEVSKHEVSNVLIDLDIELNGTCIGKFFFEPFDGMVKQWGDDNAGSGGENLVCSSGKESEAAVTGVESDSMSGAIEVRAVKTA